MTTINQTSIYQLFEQVQHSSSALKVLPNQKRQDILLTLASLIEEHSAQIIIENKKDVVKMDDSNPKKDRLILNKERIKELQDSLKNVACLDDPIGHVLRESTLDNGLEIQKVSTPLGVVGVIYESRPNVTIDVAALCIRSGNGVILRGGSDAAHSNECLVGLIHKALVAHRVDAAAILLMPTDRALVKPMLEAKQYIDIIIPRGSQTLIDFVRDHAKVPTIETGAGVCHTYVSAYADLDKAAAILVNAKVSRPSVCNALDTILVHESVAAKVLSKIVGGMQAHNVVIHADAASKAVLEQEQYPFLEAATEGDFGKEYLGFECSVKIVKDTEEALQHIAKYSSKHSEAIVSENDAECLQFMNRVDAAAVYTNASTRFTDGGVFGLGAEIGISTQKLHARGPFALEKLTTEKWLIKGSGQVRS